jgi:hypothetical protein
VIGSMPVSSAAADYRFFAAGMRALGDVAAAARSGGAGAGDDAEPRRHDEDGERFEPVAGHCPEPSRQLDVGTNGSRCHTTPRPVTWSRSAFRSQHRQLPAPTTSRGAWGRRLVPPAGNGDGHRNRRRHRGAAIRHGEDRRCAARRHRHSVSAYHPRASRARGRWHRGMGAGAPRACSTISSRRPRVHADGCVMRPNASPMRA